MTDFPMLGPAKRLSERIPSDEDELPREILNLTPELAGIVIEIDGVDCMLTLQRVPKQRLRSRRH